MKEEKINDVTTKMDNSLITYLQRFATIPLEDIPIILNCFSVMNYKPGTVLLPAGEHVTKLYFIEKGLLKLIIPRGDQEGPVFAFVEEGQLIGMLHLFSSSAQFPQELKTVTEAEIWSLDLDKFEELCSKLVYMKCAFIEAAKVSITGIIIAKSTYTGLTAGRKYEKLVKIQRNIAYNAPLKDIASYLEITPQSFSRIRKKFVYG